MCALKTLVDMESRAKNRKLSRKSLHVGYLESPLEWLITSGDTLFNCRQEIGIRLPELLDLSFETHPARVRGLCRCSNLDMF